jgi:endonuclease G, mitochondrial
MIRTHLRDERLLDVGEARGAAERYRQHQLPESGAAERARHDNRKQYLKATLTHERARAVVREAESHGTPRSAAETLASLANERIIGSRDLRDINYLEVAIAVARAICRIRIGGGAGSGVLVGPGLLMTNHHVLRSAAEALAAEAQFDYQENVSGALLPVQPFRLDPRRFFVTDPALDFTVVAVADASARDEPISRYPWLKLIPTLGKAEKGDPLNIIQHPRGGLKQIALRNNEIIDIPAGKPDFLYYTTDTEPGSSGSPCFNDQWELVALHHSGVPRMAGDDILKRDGTPFREGEDDPALIEWIANEGARVSAIVNALRSAPLDAAARELRDAALGGAPPNPVELARTVWAPAVDRSSPRADTPASSGAGAPGGAAVSISVPLTITLSFGTPAPAAAATIDPAPAPPPAPIPPAPAPDAGRAEPAVALAESLAVDPDWSTRAGYDPGFLGIRVPLPELSAEMAAGSVEVPREYRVGGDPHVLAYHHYSLAMNRARGFAWYSAANVDGLRRPELPERKDDRWRIDPRIDDPAKPRVQHGEALYSAARTDRGHLTRYLDVAWGTLDEAMHAAADTFHFTNCCLQLSDFNQRTSRWQGIEQFLLERKARRDRVRISVITGPLFGDDDPEYRNERMDAPVRIPLAFWKVCALVRDDGTLSATAFILDQKDVTDLPGFEEFVDVREAQTTVAEVEARTGLRFPVLRDHDHLADGGAPGTLEFAGQPFIPLRSYDDIVV